MGSLLGALRAVAQTISYEVRMTLIILGAVLFFFFDMTQEKQLRAWGWLTAMTLIFFVMVFLAEYMAIIFMSVLCSILFLAARYAELLVGGMAIGFFLHLSPGDSSSVPL